jgi:hypothetical protein
MTALQETMFAAQSKPLALIRQAAQNLSAFHCRVAKMGVERALEEYGLKHLIGGPPQEIIPVLVDILAGPGALLEEAVARSALVDWLAKEPQESYASWRQHLQGDSSAAAITVNIRDYLAAAIFHKLCSDLGEPLEAQAQDVATGLRHRQTIKFFIYGVCSQLGEGDSLDIDWPQADQKTWIFRQLDVLLSRLESSHVK